MELLAKPSGIPFIRLVARYNLTPYSIFLSILGLDVSGSIQCTNTAELKL